LATLVSNPSHIFRLVVITDLSVDKAFVMDKPKPNILSYVS